MSNNDDKKSNPKNLFKRGESWVLDFTFRGQRYTEVLGPVNRTIAKETRDKRIGDAAAGRLEIGTKIEDLLFETAVEKYLEWYGANRGAYTYKKYAVPASKALKTSFDGKRLSQITPYSIERHKLDRKRGPDTENQDRKAVTDTTINHDLTFLRSMFNACIKWKYAKVNPMGKVSLFDIDDGRTRVLSQDQAEKLLLACGPDLRVLVLAALHTGFRKSELQSLRWQNFDMLKNTVTVESRYTKNGEARTVPLSNDLATALNTVLQKREPRPDDFVFLHEGHQWKAWRRSFRSALKAAGISDFRWHDLRHCFGTWLAMNDVNNKAHMELMGHKDPKMTLRYTHISDEYKKRAVAKLPEFGKSVLESQQISQQAEDKVVVAFSR
jgi:integrase